MKNHPLFKITFFLLLFIYLFIESSGNGDFYIYYSASKQLFISDSIYKILFGQGFHYLYSLFFAIILYPFTFLPFMLCKFLWLCLNVYLLYKSFKIIFSYLDLSNFSIKKLNIFYSVILIFLLRVIHENIHASQITIVILYLCLSSIDFIFHKNKILLGALLLSIGINIKLLPIVLIPYLLYRAKLKAVLYVLVFCLLLWGIPILFLGYAKNLNLLMDWWLLINPSSQKNILDVEERSFHGLSTLLSVLCVENVPDVYALPIKRNIINVSLQNLSIILNSVRLLLLALTLYFLNSLPFKSVQSKSHQLYELSYIFGLVPLIFPHQQHYAFLFFMPAIVVLIYFMFSKHHILKKNQKNSLIVFLIVVFLSFNLKVLLGEFNPIYDHFKILTYGAIGLLGLLFYKPIKDSYN